MGYQKTRVSLSVQ